MLFQITRLLKHNINIVQQINKSSSDFAYNLFDLDCNKESKLLKKINDRIEIMDNVLRQNIYLS